MQLSSILDPNFICCNIEGSSREEVYTNLLKNAAKHISIDIKEMTELLMGREDDIQIPYEMGIALPHGRCPKLTDLTIIVATLATPVKLKENDFSETEIIVMSLISESTSDTYLKTLAAFTKFLINGDNREKIKVANKPQEIISVLESVTLKKTLTAEDIMNTEFASVSINAPVSEALNIFTRENKSQIPVVDDNKTLLGMIDASEIIGRAVPQYIMDMVNINFLTSFEPFEQLLSSEEELMVKDYVRQPNCIIKPTTPLIQITLPMVKKQARNLIVVDNDDTLLGIVTIQEVINKVLRG